MSESPLITVRFVIGGRDFDPNDVSRAIGLEPTRVWHATHKAVINDTRFNTVSWCIGYEKLPLYSTDEAVKQVLKLIWPHREPIGRYLRHGKVSATLVCNVTIWEDRPVYELSADTMQRLSALGCEFVLDIFDYSD